MSGQEWKFPALRNSSWVFLVLYAVILVVYGLYSWFVAWLMTDVIMKDRSWDKNNSVSLFVVFSTGLVLVLLNLAELEREKEKIRHIVSVVNAHKSLLNLLMNNFDTSKKKDGFVIVEKQSVMVKNAQIEILVFILSSVLYFVGEMASGKNSGAGMHIYTIIRTKMFEHLLRNIHYIAVHPLSRFTCDAFFEAFLTRLNQMYDAGVVKSGSSRVNPKALEIERMIHEARAFVSAGDRFWAKLAVRVFGVFYLLCVPFLLWITQGWMAILWAVVAFVTFGTVIFYRYYMGDFLTHPTEAEMEIILVNTNNIAIDIETYISASSDHIQRFVRNFYGRPYTFN